MQKKYAKKSQNLKEIRLSLKVVKRKAAKKLLKSSQTTIDLYTLLQCIMKGILVRSFSRVSFVVADKVCCKK